MGEVSPQPVQLIRHADPMRAISSGASPVESRFGLDAWFRDRRKRGELDLEIGSCLGLRAIGRRAGERRHRTARATAHTGGS